MRRMNHNMISSKNKSNKSQGKRKNIIAVMGERNRKRRKGNQFTLTLVFKLQNF